jgi:hypothetical protein
MAFSDDMIRAIVKAGSYTDARAEAHLAETIIKRRDAIGRAYLPTINPIVDPALTEETLTFGNAAVAARVAQAPTDGYRAEWFLFDNALNRSTPLGMPTTAATPQMRAPATLPTSAGAMVRIDISAVDGSHPSWRAPVETYFVRTATGWTLVGLERLPAGPLEPPR